VNLHLNLKRGWRLSDRYEKARARRAVELPSLLYNRRRLSLSQANEGAME